MEKIWKKNFYINIILLILYLLLLLWDMYIKKGNSSLGDLLILFPIISAIHFFISIIIFVIRWSKKLNNRFAFVSILFSFFLSLSESILLFFLFASVG
jgi:hypothetical protein